jgi:hypothetical protein
MGPSLSSGFDESFPNVVAAAMVCEVPCALTDAGGSALVVGDKMNVVMTDYRHALAATIQLLPTYLTKDVGCSGNHVT